MNDSFDEVVRNSVSLIGLDAPVEYRVPIKFSNHFLGRIRTRHRSSQFDLLVDVIGVIKDNYPLIVYYSRLDSFLPERGRLESDKYLICGDIIDSSYVLRTFYWK